MDNINYPRIEQEEAERRSRIQSIISQSGMSPVKRGHPSCRETSDAGFTVLKCSTAALQHRGTVAHVMANVMNIWKYPIVSKVCAAYFESEAGRVSPKDKYFLNQLRSLHS